ncbi:MAG TPA: pilus assembly protein TadG-related protein, partial [Oscillospiraceae bacterium]|nr:pilus assembly protein TadG-related protein [Oscillospiraceae bacterium]
MRFNSFKRYLQNERGTAIVILAGAMTLLMACTALVADIGVNFVTQSRLAVAADAAALAGATKFKDGAAQVQETALAIAAQNGIKAEDVIVNVAGSGKEVTVTATAPVQLFFARSFSKQEGDMAQSARVIAGRPTAMTNIVPLGINENANFE